MARAKSIKISEDDVHIHVAKVLRAYARTDICWWTVPNHGWRGWKAGKKLKDQGVRKGASDLMLLIDKVLHCLELKVDKGEQSDDQEKFQEDIIRAGGKYYLAKSFKEAMNVLVQIRALRIQVIE